uniref:Uncharacterized protein n=1 Tax=Leersia perrieri TaxID=77586 RepID=A0A0D9X8J1_9ORYZ
MATKIITLAVVSSFLLLLLLAPATTAISISGGGSVGGGITGGATGTTVTDDTPPFVFPGAAAAGCWNAVLQAEICAGDILRSVASFLLHLHADAGGEAQPLNPLGSGAVHVGAPCCGVLKTVGDRCFRDLLADSPFHPLYAPFINHVCGGGGLPVGGIVPGHRD